MSTIQPYFVYGTAWKEDRTAALTEMALRAGFRAIDTANQRKHYFEAGVGQAIAAVCKDSCLQRRNLFLQTKFTYLPGQDHRLPYDPSASLSDQVAQSMASSLEHLGTGYVDSYVLHGPASGNGWTEYDSEVWSAMLREREAGRALALGVSNVNLRHLQQMPDLPQFVQNRCFARLGWDRAVRRFCRDHGIVYQGFSLLTANAEVATHSLVRQLASREQVTPAQIVFKFALAVGMLPLTGTSDPEHMRQDLASDSVKLTPEEVDAIESLVA